MKYRKLGRTGEKVSAVGVGGFHLSLDHVDEELAIRIVRSAIDRGITFMDNSWDYTAEHEEWSRPEMFWEVRKDRRVRSHRRVLTPREKAITSLRIVRQNGWRGLLKAFENERVFYSAIRRGKLGYCLYRGEKPIAAPA